MQLHFLDENEMNAEFGDRQNHYPGPATGPQEWGECECDTCVAWREWDHAMEVSDHHMVIRERMRAAALRHETLMLKGVLVEPTDDGIAVTFAPREPSPKPEPEPEPAALTTAAIFNAIATNIPDAEAVLTALNRRALHGAVEGSTIEATHLRSIFNAIANHARRGIAVIANDEAMRRAAAAQEARERAYEDQADRAVKPSIPSDPVVLRALAELNETVRRMDAVLVGMAHRERERQR